MQSSREIHDSLADQAAKANRAAVRHYGDHPALQAPTPAGAPVDARVDILNFEKMIAAGDAANDRIMADPAAALDIIGELPEVTRRPAALAMHVRQVLLQVPRIDVTPDTAAAGRCLQPGRAVAKHRSPARRIHRYVAAALEKPVAENAVEARSETIELIAGHVGGDEAHAAPDVPSITVPTGMPAPL
jgi:hypothetical protein